MVTDNQYFLSERQLGSFEAKGNKELFTKWGLNSMVYQIFNYTEYIELTNAKEFVKHFFNYISTRKLAKDFSTFVNFNDINLQSINPKVTNISFFDRLETSGLVRKCGSITKCYDEMINDILISDELHKMILSKESVYYNLYSEEDRLEFIFHIFKHIVIGGPCCQFEDNVKSYIEITKVIYKDLMSIKKNVATQKLSIESVVFMIFLPIMKEYDFCYIILDLEKRQLILWYCLNL